MNSRLVNVRLDAQRIRRARQLRSRGITLSELIRDAIDRKYEELMTRSPRRDVAAVMKSIYAKYPDPAGQSKREYDVHDRTEARAAITSRLHKNR
jgi:hypothetical protein